MSAKKTSTTQMIGEDTYVLVKKGTEKSDPLSTDNGAVSKDEKTPVTTMISSSMMKTAMRAAGKGPTKLRTKVSYFTRISSGAATSLSWNLALDPSVTGEWAQYKVLFDEYKCHGATIRYAYETNSVANGILQKYAIRYTEFNANTPTTIAECMVADQNQMGVFTGAIGACLSSAYSRDKTNGMNVFRVKIPKGTAVSANPYVAGQQWVSTVEAAGPIHGYISGFADASAALTSLLYIVTFDIEYRSRF